MLAEKIKKLYADAKLWILSKHLGIPVEQILYNDWYANVVNRRGRTPQASLRFKHVIRVDWKKLFDLSEQRFWKVVPEAQKYFGYHKAVYLIERGAWNSWTGEFEINGIGDCDEVFVGTDSDEDALMIALKFS